MQLGVALEGSSNRSCFHLLLFELSRWYTQVNFYRHRAQSGIQQDLLLTVPAISNPCDLPGIRHRYGKDLLKEPQGRKEWYTSCICAWEQLYVAFWIDNLIFFGSVLNCSLYFTRLNLFQEIDFSVCRRIPSEHTQSMQVEVYQLFLWSSLLFFAVVHPVRILSQSSAMPSCIAPFPPRSFPRPYPP